MNKTENFRDYPKILKIEDDGQIVGLDKQGRFNSDFYTNNIDNRYFYNVFGVDYETLHEKYVNENYSRYEKNRNNYEDSTFRSTRPENYYNERDFKRDLDQQNEIKNSKRKNKWLGGLLVVAVVIIAFIFVSKYFSNDNANNDQASVNQDANNQQLQSEINDTKSQLKDSQQNEQATQQKINDLQSKIDNMKADNTNESGSSELQDGVNQLQEAQNNKVNGNEEEMKENLKKVDDVIDTEKISKQGKNQWEKFKNWLDENVSF